MNEANNSHLHLQTDESYRKSIIDHITAIGMSLCWDSPIYTATGAELDALGAAQNVSRIGLPPSQLPKPASDDGGPAYPSTLTIPDTSFSNSHNYSFQPYEVGHTVHNPVHVPFSTSPGQRVSHPGMSMRDHFAGEALARLCNEMAVQKSGEDYIAGMAYRVADAMLRARKVAAR